MNKDVFQSILVDHSLKMLSPLIRSSLLNDIDFIGKYSISVDAEVSFGGNDLAFKRSDIFSNIKKSFEAKEGIEITSVAGKKWQIEVEDHEEGRVVFLNDSNGRIRIPDLSYFAPEVETRLRCLEDARRSVNLSEDAFERWNVILTKRVLDDEELNDLLLEINDTPVRRKELILSSLKCGTSNISDFVPTSLCYYERLIGKYQDYDDISEYASSKDILNHFEKLISWDCTKGFLFSILMSGHSSLGKSINVASITESLPDIYEIIRDEGDLFSQLGAIELGFSLLDKVPDIEPIIEDIIRGIINYKTVQQKSRYDLFASIVVLVDGELARRKLFYDKPPFWRRLAAFTQAGLIEGCMIEAKVSSDKFTSWAYQYRGNIFYMQSLVDLYREPRWQPDLLSPEQLRAEVSGRIVNAAQTHRDNIKRSSLFHLLLDDNGYARKELAEYPYAFLPGPLEGRGAAVINETPKEVKADIEEKLSSQYLDVDSFNSLINTALVFRGNIDHANLAAKAIQSVDYQINNLRDIETLTAILSGLATVAASTRSTELANVVRLLTRRCLQEKSFNISP